MSLRSLGGSSWGPSCGRSRSSSRFSAVTNQTDPLPRGRKRRGPEGGTPPPSRPSPPYVRPSGRGLCGRQEEPPSGLVLSLFGHRVPGADTAEDEPDDTRLG